ncbi:MAG: aldehyde dehydrogenase [Deltaproteobacteria bacterium RBG_16_71_12]|nr:MAG: aldehyde dehydrogenase [Deltaproteobacteria bacterium RBG_16_71_12]
MIHRPFFIAGSWRESSERMTIRSPYDDRELCSVSLAQPQHVEEAIAAAAKAFAVTRKMPTWQRAELCRKTAASFGARGEELALAMVDEGGKPIGDARAEVDRAVHCFEVAASEAETQGGEVMPLDLRPSAAGRIGFTKRVPVGPVSAISPFNFPLNLAVHKVAPALAVGCPVVLKPAPQTPTVCLQLAEIIDAAGWPKGCLSVLPSLPQVADQLVTDERMKMLTFTGSPEVGWELKRRSGKKKVVLELGSNAAVIVDDGADLSLAVPRIVYGAFSYAGQKCISVQRIYVHDKVYDAFLSQLLAATAKVKHGDPRDPEVLVGPMINQAAAVRVEQWIDEAKARGARVLAGGARHGSVMPATVLVDVPPDAKLSCAEAFGPVVTVDRFRDFDEALRRVNDSRFGLQAGVFTADLNRTLRSWSELEMGGVIINDIPTWRIDPMPYGGVKDSGLGREGLRSSMEEMTELRLLVVNAPV